MPVVTFTLLKDQPTALLMNDAFHLLLLKSTFCHCIRHSC